MTNAARSHDPRRDAIELGGSIRRFRLALAGCTTRVDGGLKLNPIHGARVLSVRTAELLSAAHRIWIAEFGRSARREDDGSEPSVMLHGARVGRGGMDPVLTESTRIIIEALSTPIERHNAQNAKKPGGPHDRWVSGDVVDDKVIEKLDRADALLSSIVGDSDTEEASMPGGEISVADYSRDLSRLARLARQQSDDLLAAGARLSSAATTHIGEMNDRKRSERESELRLIDRAKDAVLGCEEPETSLGSYEADVERSRTLARLISSVQRYQDEYGDLEEAEAFDAYVEGVVLCKRDAVRRARELDEGGGAQNDRESEMSEQDAIELRERVRSRLDPKLEHACARPAFVLAGILAGRLADDIERPRKAAWHWESAVLILSMEDPDFGPGDLGLNLDLPWEEHGRSENEDLDHRDLMRSYAALDDSSNPGAPERRGRLRLLARLAADRLESQLDSDVPATSSTANKVGSAAADDSDWESRVIALIVGRGRSWSVADLARAVGVSRSTLYRNDRVDALLKARRAPGRSVVEGDPDGERRYDGM